MRTTLDLPDPLFREVKVYAAQQGLKMKELLTAFIEDGLRGEKVRSDSAARSPLPIARLATGVPLSALSNARLAEIFDAEDAARIHGGD